MCLKKYLVLFLVCLIALSVQNSFAEIDDATPKLLRPGFYINTAEQNRSCVVVVQERKEGVVSIEAAQKTPLIYPSVADYAMFQTRSEEFYLSELRRQVLSNDGIFRIESRDGRSRVSGRVSKKPDGKVFWTVNVSRSECFGLCTGSATSCTVQVK